MNKYIFPDTSIIDRYSKVALMPGEVKKSGVLLEEGYFSTPSISWEARIDNGYPNVFYDDIAKEYRCYYTVFTVDHISTLYHPKDRTEKFYKFKGEEEKYPPRESAILLATSKDSPNWERPSLGIVEFNGSRDNNIIMYDAHGASVFLDHHEADPEKRYKMMICAKKGMAVSFSADGIHFGEPIYWAGSNPRGDTHNFAF